MKYHVFLSVLILSGLCFSQTLPLRRYDTVQSCHYDLRNDLQPKRLTIAMWDFSWLWGHYPGGYFEDFSRSLDELKERSFNTVRIDAFPLILHQLNEEGKDVYTKDAEPLLNWGHSTIKYDYPVKSSLVEFMRLTQEKGIYVILSTWGMGDREKYKDKQKIWQAWDLTLDILKEEDLLGHVLYVDLDQEFPYFSPFQKHILETLLAEKPTEESKGLPGDMEAGGGQKSRWNQRQLAFVKDYLDTTLDHFQKRYPYLRFTFSLTSYWEEIRSLQIHKLDVLELHIWMDDERFRTRTDWGTVPKDRNPENDYKVYMKQIQGLMKSMRPMLLKDMENKMAFADCWAKEIGVPLTTTEAWGPWWHMDHPDLEWQWLADWCADCVKLSTKYDFWGVTPWNFSHPYWENWSNIDWYCKVNNSFLEIDESEIKNH